MSALFLVLIGLQSAGQGHGEFQIPFSSPKIGEVAAKQTEEYDKHLGHSPADIYEYE